MKKIYTILRNNQHEGPFSLEELISVPVESHDFIRIEGEGKGWLYAADIIELQSFFEQPAIVDTAQDYLPPSFLHTTVDTPSAALSPLPDQSGPVFIKTTTSGEEPVLLREEPVVVTQVTAKQVDSSPVLPRVPENTAEPLPEIYVAEERTNETIAPGIPTITPVAFENADSEKEIYAHQKGDAHVIEADPLVLSGKLPEEKSRQADDLPAPIITEPVRADVGHADSSPGLSGRIESIRRKAIQLVSKLGAAEPDKKTPDARAHLPLSSLLAPKRVQTQADSSVEAAHTDSTPALPAPSNNIITSSPGGDLQTASSSSIVTAASTTDQPALLSNDVVTSASNTDQPGEPLSSTIIPSSSTDQPAARSSNTIRTPVSADALPAPIRVDDDHIILLPAANAEEAIPSAEAIPLPEEAAEKPVFVSLPKTARVPAASSTPQEMQSPVIVIGSNSERVAEPLSFEERVEESRKRAALLPPVVTTGKGEAATSFENTVPDPYVPAKAWTRASGKKVLLQPKADPRKKYGPIALAAVVLATAVLLGISYFNRDSTADPDNLSQSLPGEEPIATGMNTVSDSGNPADASTGSIPPSGVEAEPVQAAPLPAPQVQTQKSEVAASTTQEGSSRRDKQQDDLVKPTNSKAEPPVAKLPPPAKQEVVKEAAKKPAADLTDQVYLASNFASNDNETGIHNINVTLQNKSAKLLKTVAVIVSYVDNAGRLLNKQTLYFSDIKAGESVTRGASQHKLASKVSCELGLISSEGVLYYAN